MPGLQLLLVEDSPDDADLLLRELRRGGFDPVWSRVETERTFLAALLNPPEIILSDYSMPQFSGLRALELLRASGLDIPFILISGTVGEDVAVQAMRDGATDYLLKDRPARLVSSVKRALAETQLRVERNQAEVAQARLAAIVTSSDDAIIGKTLKGIIMSWNAGAERVFGYTPAEAVGRSMLMLFPPDRVDEEPDMLARVARGESVRHFETVRVRKDGVHIDVSVTLSPLADHDGRTVGVSTIARDITERKRAEDELGHSGRKLARAESEFRSLFASNPLPMWIYDETTLRFLEVNNAAVQRYGYDRDEFLAMTIQEIRPAEDVQAFLADVARPRDPWRYAGNWRHRFKSGQIIDVDITSHQITFAGVAAALVVAQDITERKRAEEALKTAEERTRFALENADVGIWDMDYTTGALRWSEVAEAHYGLQPGTFTGTFEAFLERVHPDDRKTLLETVGNAMKTGADFSTQNRSIWPDGTIRWLSGTGRVLLGEHGEPVRAVGISLDVTERRSLEEQYQQAQKMEAVGRLAGGVAHDFNNLLTVILGYCELMLPDFKPGDPHQADIEEIQKAGARAAGLTRQLLAFSRKQIIEPKLLDLNLIATDMQSMLERLIGEDVKIVLALRPALARVKADRGQVEQVVMNLAVNARDAMPSGGTLTIETANVELDEHYAKTHRSVTPGSYVALTVTDTGTGMTPGVQARLFEPFFTTKEVGKGTGLGMATVYGIVTRSGGSIGVYSEIGKGSSFKVYLPSVVGGDAVVDPPAPKARPLAGTQTVLVVEDEAGLRELARKLLQKQSYTVLVAANADEALRLFAANPSIDVLLTDVVMPGSSGPELTRQLVEQRPDLRVIYMSGYTEDAIVQHGILKPGIAFLNKPFNSETLGAKIREVLER